MTRGTIARHRDSGGNYVGPLKRAALVKINPRLAGGTYAWPMGEKHPPPGRVGARCTILLPRQVMRPPPTYWTISTPPGG